MWFIATAIKYMKLLKLKLTEAMHVLGPTGHVKCPLAAMAAVTDGTEL